MGHFPGHFVGHFLGHFETPIVSHDFTRVRRVSPLFLAVGTLGHFESGNIAPLRIHSLSLLFSLTLPYRQTFKDTKCPKCPNR